MEKEFNKVDAKIIGADGNVFNLIGICQRVLRKNGYNKETKEMQERIYKCKNYDEALNIMMDYVNPISVNDEINNNYELE